MNYDSFVDQQCELLGLVLTPAQRPGVVRYLQMVGTMAPRVMDFAMTPADESGSTFKPVSPPAEAP